MVEPSHIVHARALLPKFRIPVEQMWVCDKETCWIPEPDVSFELKAHVFADRKNLTAMLEFIKSYDMNKEHGYSSFADVSKGSWWLGIWYYVFSAYCAGLTDTLMQIAPKHRCLYRRY